MTLNAVKTAAAAALAAALTFGVTAATVHAGTVTKPVVTGIGFDDTEAGATGRAIRAWSSETSDRYGRSFADFGKARQKDLSCDFIGGAKGAKAQRKAIGVDGNPNAKWTCTATARPVGYVADSGPRPGPRPDNVTGVGFAQHRNAARSNAIQAWRKAARSTYGKAFDTFAFARNKDVSCDRIGKGFAAKRSGKSVDVIGNPNAPWTCTATGEPRSLIGGIGGLARAWMK